MNATETAESSSNQWLVSFGDLLTLLLCFFISVFALYQPNESNGSSSAITSTATAATTVATAGTGIAKNELQRLFPFTGFELLFKAEELKEGTDLVRRQLEDLIKSKGYKHAAVLIEGCSSADGQGNSANWQRAWRRVDWLHRQLIDAGGVPDEVRKRVVGKHCGLISKSGAAVRMIFQN
jgi:hypothetical protein